MSLHFHLPPDSSNLFRLQVEPASQYDDENRLRSDYKELLNRTRSKKHDLVSSDATAMRGLLDRANELHGHVTKPTEAVVDAEIFVTVTDVGVEITKKMASGLRAYSPTDLVRYLKARFDAGDGETIHWGAIRDSAKANVRPAPVCFHMLGPMNAAPREKRKVAQRRKKEPVVDAVRPDEVGNLGMEEEKQETDRLMEKMWSVLKSAQEKRVRLVELVLNHQSFSQTVENLFTLSFLVRDSKVELREDNQGHGVEVVTLAREVGEKNKNKTSERLQCVVSLDFDEWERWKKVVSPEQTLLEDRYDGEQEHEHKRTRID